jgi:hypothetical protein
MHLSIVQPLSCFQIHPYVNWTVKKKNGDPKSFNEKLSRKIDQSLISVSSKGEPSLHWLIELINSFLFLCEPTDLHIGAQPRLKGTGFAALGTTKAFASVYGPCPLGRRMTYSDDGYLRTQVKLMTNSRAERLEEKVKNRSASREERELSAFLRMALRPALLLVSYRTAVTSTQLS